MAIQLDVGHEPLLYTKKEYEQSNKRLCRILDDYNNRDADSFLNACSCYVGAAVDELRTVALFDEGGRGLELRLTSSWDMTDTTNG
ncbi:hypothetical protein HPB47_011194 [Ixodes persulcatus]|uniref:Uncharacterized protein n=1 Tax=Ixodes persulcatus TaxID=34615 RepID=A0AC60NX06_IXOPE|nr:hypothetical protein HPB47_011194 [Ixodes persulcatus]